MLLRIALKVEKGEILLRDFEGKPIPVKWDGDVGGLRDVGKHMHVEPLPTCWPLVEQVFHYLAEQVCSTSPVPS